MVNFTGSVVPVSTQQVCEEGNHKGGASPYHCQGGGGGVGVGWNAVIRPTSRSGKEKYCTPSPRVTVPTVGIWEWGRYK